MDAEKVAREIFEAAARSTDGVTLARKIREVIDEEKRDERELDSKTPVFDVIMDCADKRAYRDQVDDLRVILYACWRALPAEGRRRALQQQEVRHVLEQPCYDPARYKLQVVEKSGLIDILCHD